MAARLVPWRVAPILGWAGLVLVVLAGVLLNETTPFPGVAALLPTVGSALVIASGLAVAVAAGGRSGSRIPGPAPILALAPVRYLGRISYSLYLWHWPLLVLPAVALGSLPGPVRLGLVALAIVVAAASQRWVEEPIRHGRIVGTRPRRVLAIAGAATMGVAAFGLALGVMATTQLQPTGPTIGGTIEDVPLPTAVAISSAEPGTAEAASPRVPLDPAPVPADLAPSLAAARDDNPVIYDDGCHLDHLDATLAECAYGDIDADRTVVLFGDSHAAQWFPTLERIATERGWRLVSLTKSACSPLDIPVWSGALGRPYRECDQWRAAVIERVQRERPDMVVLSSSYVYQLAIDGAASPVSRHDDVWTAGLRTTIGELADAAGSVVVVGDTVRMRDDPPVCLSDHLDNAAACATPFGSAVKADRLAADAATATDAGAIFVDPTPWMCGTEPCSPVLGRLLIYRDEHHMTATFARALAVAFADAIGIAPLGRAAP